MSGPVLWGVPPMNTESLMSHVTRTVTRNTLPSVFTLLEQVGVRHAQNPTAAFIPHLDEAGLAHILRVDVEEVRRRRHDPVGEPGYRDFFGVAMRAEDFLVRTLRFSPTSVAESAHHRALWSLKTVPCCPDSWEYLVERCRCGAIQRWAKAFRFDRCTHCNANLGRMKAATVPDDIRPALRFLLGIISPDAVVRASAHEQLPSVLSSWGGGMVFELALALMPVTEEGYVLKRGYLPPLEDLPIYTRALAQAAGMILEWPNSLQDAFKKIVVDRSRSRAKVRYLGVGAYLSGLESLFFPEEVRMAIGRGLEGLGSGDDEPISMRAAAHLIGHNENTLIAARRDGLLRTVVQFKSARVFPTMSRTEANYLSDFLPNRVGPDRASTLLGLPKYAIGMLRDEGILTIEGHPYVVHRYGPDQVDGRDLNTLLERLRSAGSLRPSLQNPTPLHRVARSLGGGLKPWGRIFSDLLNGCVVFSMSGKKISTIEVEHRYAETLRRLNLAASSAETSGACPQRDMVEILNLPLKHVNTLPSMIALADGQYDLRQILDVASGRITLTEMSAITGMNSVTLDAFLTGAGYRRTDDFGWIRSRSLTHFLSQIRGGSNSRRSMARSARRDAASIRPRRQESSSSSRRPIQRSN